MHRVTPLTMATLGCKWFGAMRTRRLMVVWLCELLLAARLLAGGWDANQNQAKPGPDTEPLTLSPTVGLGKEVTVLVVLAPDCSPCLASLSFYKRILGLPRMDGIARRFVVLAQNGVIPVKRVLDAQSVTPHALTSGPAATHDVKELPTLIVVDRQGRRLGAWVGHLTPEQEKVVLELVGQVRERSEG